MGDQLLLAPLAGLCLLVVTGYWCGWMGRSATAALVATLVVSTLINALALAVRRGTPFAVRTHVPVLAAGLLAFVLAVIPLARLGHPAPIGVNGDQVLYSNVTAYLEGHGLPAPEPAGYRPAVVQLSFIGWGLPLGFNYLHAVVGALSGLEAHESFSLATALLLFLNVLALALLARSVFGLRPTGVYLTAALAAVSPAFLWVHYNDYGMHAISLALIPMALATTALALEEPSWRARALAALMVAAAFTSYPYATAPLAFGPLAIYVVLLRLGPRQRIRTSLVRLAAIAGIVAVLNAPGVVHVAKLLLFMFKGVLVKEFGDVARHVPWPQVYGLAHHAVDTRAWPFGWLPGSSVALGLAALVVTAYGALQMRGRARLLFVSLILAYLPFIAWLRFGLDYPYGTFKALTSATFAALIGLAFGLDRLAVRPARWSRTMAGALAAVLLLTNGALAFALARSVSAVDLAPLVELRRAAGDGVDGERIHVRDDRDTGLLWITYFLRDHDLSLAHSSPYFVTKDWPFYREAIDAALVLVRSDGIGAAPWAAGLVHDDGRHRLLRREPGVLTHVDFENGPRMLARGAGVRIGVHADRLEVDGASFSLGAPIAAPEVALRLGLFARQGSSIDVAAGPSRDRIRVAEDIAVIERSIASLPVELSLVNTGDRAIALAGWFEIAKPGARRNVEPEALFSGTRGEVVPGSGLFAADGWLDVERDAAGRWAAARSHAVFRNPSKVVTLHLQGRLPDAPGTAARVWLNDRMVGGLDRPGPFDVSFVVPTEVLGSGSWGHLAMEVNRNFNPGALGLSDDRRDLGVLVTGAQFRSLELPAGGLIALADDAGQAYLGRGWSTPDKLADDSGRRFVWASAAESTLRFAVPGSSDYAVSFTARPFSFPSAPAQRVQVLANGRAVADIAVTEPVWRTYAFDVPRSSLVPGANELRFVFGYLAAPSKVAPGSADDRTLAMAFQSVHLRGKP